MNKLDADYQLLLKNILENGTDKEDRTGTGTRSIFGAHIKHDMQEGFPLLTTKKMPFKTIVAELIWFMSGSTDIRDLWRNKCYIWDGDWYKHYKTTCSSPYSLEEIKEKVNNYDRIPHGFHDSMFSLGPIYGHQWKNWNGELSYGEAISTLDMGIDQIQNLIDELQKNPDSRRMMVNAWNVNQLDEMVLPPCHYGFQVYTRELAYSERYMLWYKNNFETGMEWNLENKPDFDNTHYTPTPKRGISLMWNQRSVDTFLGLPFNIASYGLLLMMIADEVGMMPDKLIGNLGDTHLYQNHIEQAKEQMKRVPYQLPLVTIQDGIYSNTISDFKLEYYKSHPTIKGKLSN